MKKILKFLCFIISSFVIAYPIYILTAIIAYLSVALLYPLELSFIEYLYAFVFLPFSLTLGGLVSALIITLFGMCLLCDFAIGDENGQKR